MKTFIIGDMANGIETSAEEIEAESYQEAVEILLERSGLYIREIEEVKK